MIKLNNADYSKVKEIIDVPKINTLFAKSVVYHHVSGTIYVDNLKNPSTAYIKHPYGMSLLVGEFRNKEFNDTLNRYLLNMNNQRQPEEWLQIYPSNWSTQLEDSLGSYHVKMPKGCGYQRQTEVVPQVKVYQYQRINFSFDQNIFFKNNQNITDRNIQIENFKKETFDTFGRHVSPRHFWNNPDDFFSRSKGYSLLFDHKPISVAFASFIVGDQLEIGVETKEDYRGQGFASIICSTLIDYCLKNNYTPIWSCHAGNLGSKNLANRLGFKIAKILPYYHLV